MQGVNNEMETDLDNIVKCKEECILSDFWPRVDNFDNQDSSLGILSEYVVLVPLIDVLAVLQALSHRYFKHELDQHQLALAEIIQGRFDTTTLAPDALATSA